MFRAWGAAIHPSIEVRAIQLPGREERLLEPAISRLSDLIPRLAEAIAPEIERPFALFGHSMGALLAFELARWLQNQGLRTPLRLFVAGSRAPHLPKRNEPIHGLPQEEFIREIAAFDGIPAEVLSNVELMSLLVPVLRADLCLCERFVAAPTPSLECPISAFGGLEDPKVEPASLEAWTELTRSQFRLRMLPGHHFFLHSAQCALLDAIADDIAVCVPEQKEL